MASTGSSVILRDDTPLAPTPVRSDLAAEEADAESTSGTLSEHSSFDSKSPVNGNFAWKVNNPLD